MKKKLALLLCLVMALSLAFTGCGKETEEPVAEVEEKIEFTCAVTADFDSIDPQIMLASDSDRILCNVYEGLVSVSEDGMVAPGLAESWTFDGKVLVAQIRQGVKFHDGSELTPEDVVYSYKRMAGLLPDDQSAVKQTFQDGIESVEKTGDWEVTITLKNVNTSFEANLRPGIIKEGSASTIVDNPNGTGPYKLASYEPGVGCVLEKHEDYWGTPAYIDVVNVKMYADSTAALLAMQNGEIQMLQVTESNLEMVPDNFEKLFLSNNTTIVVQPNCKEGVFSDVRVRQALNYATDQEALIEAISPGCEQVSSFLTSLQSFYLKDNTDAYPYDPEKAKALLAEAGYPDGITFDFLWFSNLSNWYSEVTLVLQSQWAKSGITANLVDMDWSTFLSTIYSNPEREFDAALFGYTGKLDPYSGFQKLGSTYTANVMQFSNEEYDSLLAEITSTTDSSVKQKDYKRLQDIISEEAVGVWLMDNSSYIALDKEFTGYTPYVVTFWNFATIRPVE